MHRAEERVTRAGLVHDRRLEELRTISKTIYGKKCHSCQTHSARVRNPSPIPCIREIAPHLACAWGFCVKRIPARRVAAWDLVTK